jgi:hypothetical protein
MCLKRNVSFSLAKGAVPPCANSIPVDFILDNIGNKSLLGSCQAICRTYFFLPKNIPEYDKLSSSKS